MCCSWTSNRTLLFPLIREWRLKASFYRFMGGNSTKATSGINGAGTQTQQELGIPDSAKTFFEDTKKSVSTTNVLHQAMT